MSLTTQRQLPAPNDVGHQKDDSTVVKLSVVVMISQRYVILLTNTKSRANHTQITNERHEKLSKVEPFQKGRNHKSPESTMTNESKDGNAEESKIVEDRNENTVVVNETNQQNAGSRNDANLTPAVLREFENHRNSSISEIEELVRNETIRHLEFAWAAQQRLSRSCDVKTASETERREERDK